jgi:hypothetical protein
MRAYHVIAAVAAPIAEADSRFSNGIGADVVQMHQNSKNAPAQEFHDMTFVFPVNSGGD